MLEQLGVSFTQISPDVNEVDIPGDTVKERVAAIARCKAQAAITMLGNRFTLPVLAADTVIDLNGVELGKPKNIKHAAQLLKCLSGNSHRVYTSVVVKTDTIQLQQTVTTHVWFSEFSDQDIDNYCASGEPLGKAGAYAIQGKGAMFVQRIDGSYSNVMGLPIFETAAMLKTIGLKL